MCMSPTPQPSMCTERRSNATSPCTERSPPSREYARAVGTRGWVTTFVVMAMLAGAVPSAAAIRHSSVTTTRSARPTTAAPITEIGTTLGGDYQPFAGDFDGDGRDDVFLYAPGAAQDYVAYAGATRGSFTKVPFSVY